MKVKNIIQMCHNVDKQILNKKNNNKENTKLEQALDLLKKINEIVTKERISKYLLGCIYYSVLNLMFVIRK